MAISVQDRVIGGCTYRVRALGGLTGRSVGLRLFRLAGSAFSAGTKDLGAVFAKLAMSLGDDDLTYFCDVFATHTQIIKAGVKAAPTLDMPGIFDLHFAGNYLDMVNWLRFCVEVNFGSVFSGLASVARDSQEKTAVGSSESQPVVTGTSGA